MLRVYKVRPFERGLLFKDGTFVEVLREGWHVRFDPLLRFERERASVREPWLRHEQLDVIARSGRLGDDARVIDLDDDERALVWIDRRFAAILGPGLHVLWTAFRAVKVDVVSARGARFVHPELHVILRTPGVTTHLDVTTIEPGHTGLHFQDGRYVEALGPGRHAFWKGVGKVLVHTVDLRDRMADIGGQDIMTADKVTLRLNAVVTFRVADALKAVSKVGDYEQALYREAQLALREVVGGRELDALLADKDEVAGGLETAVRERARALGLEVVRLGIRDVILPGEMKTLLNRVTEAKKAAEAALITRREETAAMRSQANTAKLFDQHATLMRLRELEVLEKVAEKANLTVVLGEQGLADRVVKLL